MATNPMTQLLQDAESDLARAQENIEEKRRFFQEAQIRLSAAQASYDAYKEAHDLFEAGAKKPKRKRASKPSSATPETKKLFGAIYAQYGMTEFGYDEVMNVASRNDIGVNPVNIRSSMSDYVRAGHFERPANGRFILKETGKAYFGIVDATPDAMPGLTRRRRRSSPPEENPLQEAMRRAQLRRQVDDL